MFKTFNQHNPTETRLLSVLANGEGIITADEFKAIANATMLSRYKAAGYIKQMPNAQKGTFEITDKFKTQYRRQIDPSHRFSGSHAPAHAAGVNRVLACVPDGATVQTGQRVQREFQRITSATPAFHREMASIAAHWEQERDFYAATRPANEQEEAVLHHEAILAHEKYLSAASETVSTPDMGLRLDAHQLHDFARSMFQHYLNYSGSAFTQRLYDEGMRRLLEVDRRGDSTAHIYIEIVTDAYTSLDIFQKECWADTTDSIIVYIPA